MFNFWCFRFVELIYYSHIIVDTNIECIIWLFIIIFIINIYISSSTASSNIFCIRACMNYKGKNIKNC
jgi:hypothetical protein